MKLWPFAFLLAVTLASASELNVQGFATCLGSPAINLPALESRYHFNDLDFLIFYLAAYPGEKLPHVPSFVQTQAQARWGTSFESRDGELAQIFFQTPPHTPQDAFRTALSICSGDVFCAALTIQNVLRTFGRYGQSVVNGLDNNPDWFKNNREQWIEYIPSLQAAMISLRANEEGDRLGDWYHVFGILAYAVNEVALGHSESSVAKIVELNNLFDKNLTGNNEDPAKAQIDQDAVAMSWDFLSGGVSAQVDCATAAAYVSQ
jgi:hypothetical protein